MLSPNQIKARLIERGISQTAIARRLGVSNITVAVVIGGYGRSRRIMEYIASKIGLSFNEVWGRHNHRKAA